MEQHRAEMDCMSLFIKLGNQLRREALGPAMKPYWWGTTTILMPVPAQSPAAWRAVSPRVEARTIFLMPRALALSAARREGGFRVINPRFFKIDDFLFHVEPPLVELQRTVGFGLNKE